LVSQVAALAAAFGVPPSYLLDRDKDTSVLDEEVLEAPTDEAVGAYSGRALACPRARRE
jgi:phage portal protein BeeE